VLWDIWLEGKKRVKFCCTWEFAGKLEIIVPSTTAKERFCVVIVYKSDDEHNRAVCMWNIAERASLRCKKVCWKAGMLGSTELVSCFPGVAISYVS
jgi:hypothetical protein